MRTIQLLGGKGQVGRKLVRRLDELEIECRIHDLPQWNAVTDPLPGQRADLLVSTVPGTIGEEVARRALAAGRILVDVSYWSVSPEALGALESLAQAEKSTLIFGAGFAPGLLEDLTVQAWEQHGRPREVQMFAGAIPMRPTDRQTSTWNPADQRREFEQGALVIENGRVENRRNEWQHEFRVFGIEQPFAACLTDGLGLMIGGRIPNLSEWTLRWPSFLEALSRGEWQAGGKGPEMCVLGLNMQSYQKTVVVEADCASFTAACAAPVVAAAALDSRAGWGVDGSVLSAAQFMARMRGADATDEDGTWFDEATRPFVTRIHERRLQQAA